MIKAEVNGKPAVMVLDTGSNETIVSPRLVIVKKLSSKEAVTMAKGSGLSRAGLITLRCTPVDGSRKPLVRAN